MKTIGTHSGSFHCDEVLACYMLKVLPEYKDARYRTHDIVIIITIYENIFHGGSLLTYSVS